MKAAGTLLIAALLLATPGCVKQPDWIESTLVTVDVTGLWEGTVAGGGDSPAIRAVLDLEQEGPRVKGKLQTGGATGRGSGSLEGRVGGDLFHFTVIGGQGETVRDEVTVSGDEMEGTFTLPIMTGPQTMRISLRRIDSPSRPRTQGP
jgi:hypothetical protein